MGASQNIISNLSKDKYTLKAKSTTTISFMGASPNYYRITNGGATPLYLGVSMMPTEDFFDMKIHAGTTKLYVDAYGHEEVYIYNPSVSDANIIITSFTANFDSTVLALSDIGQDFSQIDFSGTVDATGDMKTILENINSKMPVISTIHSSLSYIKNYTQTIESTIKSLKALQNHKTVNIYKDVTNSTSNQSYTLNYIELLSNDSSSDMIIRIDNNEFTLKPNEVLNKVQFEIVSTLIIPTGSTYRLIAYEA